MNIFDYEYEKNIENKSPLAYRVRPKKLEDFVGQEDILGSNSLLYNAIQQDKLSSLIFYGPPGTGKTTLAKIIGETTKSAFINLNATNSGVKDIKHIVQEAKDRMALRQTKTTVFIDEIHRFNKSQQDALLPHVEEGVITIIGATTENPYFEVNKALLSRSMIFNLQPLSNNQIKKILERACGIVNEILDKNILDYLSDIASGDARYAINCLELALIDKSAHGSIDINRLITVLKKPIRYDKAGEEHYNIISAFIKSIRGSDPNAAVYYLGRMLVSGEDPRFIARRMIISASEDIGNADPNGLLIATAAAQGVEHVGMPECRIILSQAAIYLAQAPKSNATYLAINQAMSDAKNDHITIPLHLQSTDIQRVGKENIDEYKYPHDYPNGWVQQNYMPEQISDKIYYQPKNIGYEKKIIERLKK